jgi:hypothetical protein
MIEFSLLEYMPYLYSQIIGAYMKWWEGTNKLNKFILIWYKP